MDVIDSGCASACFKTGSDISLPAGLSSWATARFFSRQVAQGHAARSAEAVQRVVRPSVHLTTIAESPSRAIDSGRISKFNFSK